MKVRSDNAHKLDASAGFAVRHLEDDALPVVMLFFMLFVIVVNIVIDYLLNIHAIMKGVVAVTVVVVNVFAVEFVNA